MIKELWDKYKDAIPYVFFGVLTTLVNIGTFGVLWHTFHWNYQIANVLAYWLSVLFAYVTNKLWVFNSHTTTWKAFWTEMLSFFLFRGASWVMDQGIMTIGVSLFGINALIVKIFDNVVVIALNYIFSKFIIFRKRK